MLRPLILGLALTLSAVGAATGVYALNQTLVQQRQLLQQLALYQAEGAQAQAEQAAVGTTASDEQDALLATLSARLLNLESETVGNFTSRVRGALLDNPAMLFEAVEAHERAQIATQAALYADDLRGDPFTPILGNPDGDVTLVEFFDYNCGYCRRAMDEVLDLVAEDGQIRLILKEYPILSLQSQEAALVAMAAADQVNYLTLHRTAMSGTGSVDGTLMLEAAVELGADREELQAQITANRPALMSAVTRTREVTEALGISGTPAFYIEGTVIPGAVGKQELAAVIAQVRAARAAASEEG